MTIFLCPWVTPWLLGWLRLTLSAPDQANFQTLIDNFTGTFFILWVILPTAAGLACRHSLGGERVAALRSWLTFTSVTSLLLLNYANAALALPEVFAAVASLRPRDHRVPGCRAERDRTRGRLADRAALRQDADTRLALMFGLGMKHTGLALLLAGAVLAQQRLAILMIVLATLAQHLLAGVVQWCFRPADSCPCRCRLSSSPRSCRYGNLDPVGGQDRQLFLDFWTALRNTIHRSKNHFFCHVASAGSPGKQAEFGRGASKRLEFAPHG